MNSEELRFLACGISMRAVQSRCARSRGAFYESNVVSLNLREIDKNMEHLRRRDEPSARLLRGASPLRLSLPVFLAVMRALPRLLAPVVHMRVLARAPTHTYTRHSVACTELSMRDSADADRVMITAIGCAR